MKYIVQIKQYSDDKVIKELGPFYSERMAERADNGVNINLNHEEYYTITVEKPSKSQDSEG